MKKLFGTIIIAGSGMMSLVGNAPASASAVKNEINYLQTNNLENLNRSKRKNNEQNINGILQNVITTNGSVKSSGVVLNNKVYFGSDDYRVYEYDPVTNQQKVVITTGGDVSSSGVVLNNKVYFGSADSKVYEIWSSNKSTKSCYYNK